MLDGPSFLRPRPEPTRRHRTHRTVSHLKAVPELVLACPCQPLFHWGWHRVPAAHHHHAWGPGLLQLDSVDPKEPRSQELCWSRLKHLPNNDTPEMFLAMLDKEGFVLASVERLSSCQRQKEPRLGNMTLSTCQWTSAATQAATVPRSTGRSSLYWAQQALVMPL